MSYTTLFHTATYLWLRKGELFEGIALSRLTWMKTKIIFLNSQIIGFCLQTGEESEARRWEDAHGMWDAVHTVPGIISYSEKVWRIR